MAFSPQNHTQRVEELKKKADHYQKLFQSIGEKSLHRWQSDQGYQQWKEACRQFHSFDGPNFIAENPELRRKLKAGDPDLIELAITFLEADLFVFRSGYAKATVIHCIKGHPFSQEQSARLEQVVLNIVDNYDRNEFRAYCKLAASLGSPSLIESLSRRLESPDIKVRRRAKRMLDYLPHWQSSQKRKPPKLT